MKGVALFFAAMCCVCVLANPVRFDVKIPVDADLKTAGGVSFRFSCGNTAAFSGFTCYLSSGKGCYVAPFAPASEGATDGNIEILRRDVRRSEGEVSGWGDIKSITLTGWKRGGYSEKEAVFGCAGFKPIAQGDLGVVVLSGDSCVSVLPSEASGFTGAPAKMSRLFSGLKIFYL